MTISHIFQHFPEATSATCLQRRQCHMMRPRTATQLMADLEPRLSFRDSTWGSHKQQPLLERVLVTSCHWEGCFNLINNIHIYIYKINYKIIYIYTCIHIESHTHIYTYIHVCVLYSYIYITFFSSLSLSLHDWWILNPIIQFIYLVYSTTTFLWVKVNEQFLSTTNMLDRLTHQKYDRN